MTATNQEYMQQILQQETEITLDHFNAGDLRTLVDYLIDQMDKATVPLTCRVTLKEKHILFHYAANGCALDKDNWVRRKTNTVLNFGHSSQWFYYKTNGDHNELIVKYGLSLTDYTVSGGAIPILVNKIGCIGALAISGYSGPWEDHDLALNALRHLKAKQNDKLQ
jgi:uncharacterized protein (UPF0303 family)